MVGVPSVALKKRVPLKLTSEPGLELKPGIASMSLTITVPAVVPSLFHSSAPDPLPSFPEKNRVPLTFVRKLGLRVVGKTGTVPARLPSLFQSWSPVPGLAMKNRVPLTLVSSCGLESPVGLMFLSIVVPVAVPSLFQSSTPFEVPSHAAKKTVPLTSAIW